MKYLRKIVVMIITVVMFAAIVISLGVIFAVRNINVTLLTYTDDYSDSYESAKTALGIFKGQSIMFIDEQDITEAVSDSNFTVASYKKIFPCTINVTLKERLETFAVYSDGQFTMYDNEGVYLRTSVVNENINDNAPNVQFKGIAESDIKTFSDIANSFKAVFGTLRSSVASIELDSNPALGGVYIDQLIFNMRCGLKIILVDYTEYTEYKIKAAYDKFTSLTDRDKLRGTLRSYSLEGDGAAITADYSPL